MKLRTGHAGQLVLELEAQETAILTNLVGQLLSLLQSHSSVEFNPDPLFASLEVGGGDHLPEDPALARLLPNAYRNDEAATAFRRVTERGLINRKIEDTLTVSTAISAGSPDNANPDIANGTEVTINQETLGPWLRTITALRLSIAARIGLEQASDHDVLAADDEHASTLVIYDWLAAIIDLMLRFSEVLGEETIE